MTTNESMEHSGASAALLDYVPVLRSDFAVHRFDSAAVVWSPLCPEPVALEPIASVLLDVIDGEASVRDLASDVSEAVGVPLDTAERQVVKIVDTLGRAGVLTTSRSELSAAEAIARRDIFVSTSTPCSENASRLGTVSLLVRFAERTVRIACDSRKAVRTLRTALRDHLSDERVTEPDETDLAFVLTGPQGLQRHHRLIDRTGFALSEARGLDAGLHALASHLTVFLPAAPGTVRIRARALAAENDAVLVLYPLSFFPPLTEKELSRSGLRLVDRLAFDLDLSTGRIVNPVVPWPELAGLPVAPTHAGTGHGLVVTGVVQPRSPHPAGTRRRVDAVAAIASNGLEGGIDTMLGAGAFLADHARIESVTPGDDDFLEVVARLLHAG
jgi:hypothetical protein